MIKIGGGFWPFWAGKRAVFDSEVLATLVFLVPTYGFIKIFREILMTVM